MRKTYRGYMIDYGPSGLTIREPNGSWWGEVAVNYSTARRWIDADLQTK